MAHPSLRPTPRAQTTRNVLRVRDSRRPRGSRRSRRRAAGQRAPREPARDRGPCPRRHPPRAHRPRARSLKLPPPPASCMSCSHPAWWRPGRGNRAKHPGEHRRPIPLQRPQLKATRSSEYGFEASSSCRNLLDYGTGREAHGLFRKPQIEPAPCPCDAPVVFLNLRPHPERSKQNDTFSRHKRIEDVKK